MTAKAAWSTPLLHVADVPRSIRFYQTLGFELIDDYADPGRPLCWARLHCEGAAIMLLLADDELPDPAQQGILLYMYTPDLPALRARLLAAGLQPSDISRPPYMPSGELCLRDPDGYTILIGHWGDTEHTTWLRHLDERKKRASAG